MNNPKKENEEKIDLHFAFLILITFALLFTYASFVFAKEVKTLRLNNKTVAHVKISTRGTILSFPSKPTRVILGSKGSFGLEYVENDLAISPLTNRSRSNMFVYLEGRRFSFDLIASENHSSSIILIRDSFESTVKVRMK